MRNTWTHLMVSDTFYFIIDDTFFCPKDDKPYCPLTKMFRGTPHYPQRAKSSILTILTSHCKATLQTPPALQHNSTAHSAVVILTTQLLSRPI